MNACRLPLYYRAMLLRQSPALAGMHLQWFAAEDEGRTEDPSEHKLRKAREEEGRVAKSQEVPSAIVLLAAIIVLAFFAPYYVRTFRAMMVFFLQRSGSAENLLEGGLFVAFLQFFARLTLPVFAACFVAAIFANVIQFGFLFTVKPITPDLNKIIPNISRFVERVAFSTEALFNLAKSVFKVLAVCLIAYLNIRSEFGRIVGMVHAPFLQAAEGIAGIAFRIILESALFLLVLSFFDFLFQKHLHIESLKMTRQEVILERKDLDGDPLVRQRLRQRMRELLRQNIPRAVPQADVVVTNPTHFAVALEYNKITQDYPMVTAKGQDEIALHIRRIARENDVPVIENKPLARQLYAEVEIGEIIDKDHKYCNAVVALYRQVFELDKKKQSRIRQAAG
ncbi:MAG: flagellar biosynthesis protein FlhB [Spirochaetia bacterium]|jgi:flagellar biosynthetic protein FlhB|nr:flagellar biosynthesis protein FlhB [Spirochaetia bacterium]